MLCFTTYYNACPSRYCWRYKIPLHALRELKTNRTKFSSSEIAQLSPQARDRCVQVYTSHSIGHSVCDFGFVSPAHERQIIHVRIVMEDNRVEVDPFLADCVRGIEPVIQFVWGVSGTLGD